MPSVIQLIEEKYKKPHVVDVKSGDTVRVHQKIREGSKERVQVFEGLVIRVSRKNSLSATIAVRRIASGIGVEKTFLLHSPLITKVQVTKRSKVRRNYLSYMRARTGKSARLASVDFDQEEVNKVPEPPQPEAPEEAKPEAGEPQAVATETEPKEQNPEQSKVESEDKETKKSGTKKDEPKTDSPKATK